MAPERFTVPAPRSRSMMHGALRFGAILTVLVLFVGFDLFELVRKQHGVRPSRATRDVATRTVSVVGRTKKRAPVVSVGEGDEWNPALGEVTGIKPTKTDASREDAVTESAANSRVPDGLPKDELPSQQGEGVHIPQRGAGIIEGAQMTHEQLLEEQRQNLQAVQVDPKKEVTNAAGGQVEEGALMWRGAPWKPHVREWFQNCGGASNRMMIAEELHGKACPGDCSGHGVCNAEFGECRCQMGYKGLACDELDEYPCNRPSEAEYPAGRWIVSICNGFCDKRTARCYCGANSTYPERPAVDPCGFVQGKAGTNWGKVDLSLLYGTEPGRPGWCNANPSDGIEAPFMCYCNYDGQTGRFCEQRSRPYCLGGCNNLGECHGGHCKCRDGWYGVDCSVPSAKTSIRGSMPPWMHSGEKEARHTTFNSGKLAVDRRRPLIYVYDLPRDLTSHQLEGRQWKFYCAPWMYQPNNATEFNGFLLYGMEFAVYEALLAGPHRTTNPDEADYFYVPVLLGCAIARADDSPRMDMQSEYRGSRPYFSTKFALEALDFIKQKPYWERNGGKDHIWMYPWDEGACFAPQAIWSSIMLSPWGNTMTHHPGSTTAYQADNWESIPKEVRGDHPCFDPVKDIVIPAWKAPSPKAIEAKFVARPYEERKFLFYFNGNLGNKHKGRPEIGYSMGIRQQVAEYFGSSPSIEGKLGTLSESDVVVTGERSERYHDELASSRFCGVFPGDGFSARMEDSILHGCVPVIVQDGIQMPYENVLDYDQISVRVMEAEIPSMIKILRAIPEARVRAMLSAVKGLWQRWSYHSVARTEAQRQKEWYGHENEWARSLKQLQEDDAISTIIQTLHFKLYNDPWRLEKLKLSESTNRESGLPDTCPVVV
eukprot:TRINITY_DN22132_c0_g1_i1.p1 TRINITY_DN22132_c0_g1~~TRINITY_DN22132_c0_g1_i1.p1  ORF type:complete len:881 (+),score=139.06 TRINITY_DN22132_c0_g1_i1:51-2693(+)